MGLGRHIFIAALLAIGLATALVDAANRPVVVDADTPIVPVQSEVACYRPNTLAAAMKIARILKGEIASDIPVTVEDSSKLIFDSRKIERAAAQPFTSH